MDESAQQWKISEMTIDVNVSGRALGSKKTSSTDGGTAFEGRNNERNKTQETAYNRKNSKGEKKQRRGGRGEKGNERSATNEDQESAKSSSAIDVRNKGNTDATK